MSPTQRTLELLKRLGHPAAVVERWNPHARIRQDLFGILDIIALAHGHTWGLQVTTASNIAARQTKIEQNPHLPALQDAGWTILVQGWRRPTKSDRRWTALTRRYMGSCWLDVELTPARCLQDRPQGPLPILDLGVPGHSINHEQVENVANLRR